MKFVIPSVFTAVDKFSGPLSKMQGATGAFASRMERDFRKAGSTAFAVGKTAGAVGLAIAAPLGLAVKQAVDFEDAMADVAKTTGLSGKPLEALGSSILDMSKNTRTSIDDLVKIAEIGGQLGIAEKDLLSFTKSADKFNIALGSDFSGGVEEAVSQVGKIKLLFADTRGLNVSDSIMKTGSAINELGAVGAGTSANITDFTLRLGALPDALKPSITNTLALGTFLEELGIDAQIGAGGMTNFLLVAGKNISGFASQMKVSATEAKALLKQDPTEFSKRFASTFKGVAPEIMAQKLNDLGIGSQETIKVLGALGASTERLTELQNVANKSFTDGTSLSTEAAKKNDTMAAKMAKLRNNAKSLAITIGNALLPVINSIVESVMPFINSMASWIQRNKALTATIIKVVAIAGLLALAISGVSFAIGIYQKAVVIAQAAQAAWNIIMAANPIGLLVAGLIGLGAVIYSVADAFSTFSAAETVNANVQQRALDKTIDQRVEIVQLFGALRNAKAGTDAYNETLKKIDAIQPGITNKYNLQAGALKNISAAEKELTANIMKRAEAEARAELLKESIKKEMQLKEGGDSMFQKVLKFTGYESAANMIKAGDIAKEKLTQRELTKQIAAETVNPDKAKQDGIVNRTENTNNAKVEIEFTGMPAGMSANVKDKSGNKSIPKLSSTS
jgi:TP901 family phage tail tape measure protein